MNLGISCLAGFGMGWGVYNIVHKNCASDGVSMIILFIVIMVLNLTEKKKERDGK